MQFIRSDHVVHDKMIEAIEILKSNELLKFL